MIISTCPDPVVLAAHSLVKTAHTKRGCVVTTSCIYPDGTAAQVTVKQTEAGFYVTDAGRGLLQVDMSGHESQKPGQHIASAAHAFNVEYSRGMVFLRDVPVNELDTAIVLVANASVHGVVRTMAHFKLHNENNFRFAFDSYIRETYGDKFKKGFVEGANIVHTLDYVYHGEKVVVVEPLQPDRMSVDKVFSAHFDIRRASSRPSLQLLVFDSHDDWKSANLDHLRSLEVPVMEYEEARTLLPEWVPVAA